MQGKRFHIDSRTWRPVASHCKTVPFSPAAVFSFKTIFFSPAAVFFLSEQYFSQKFLRLLPVKPAATVLVHTATLRRQAPVLERKRDLRTWLAEAVKLSP